MPTRRELREARDAADAVVTPETNGKQATTRRPRKPVLKRTSFWTITALALVLVAAAAIATYVGKQLYDEAMAARDDLEQAVPLVSEAQQLALQGDFTGAATTIEQVSRLTASAKAHTNGDLWLGSEWVPIAGPNLHAVRATATAADDLVRAVQEPLSSLDLSLLLPQNGAFDVTALAALGDSVRQAANVIADARTSLDAIDRGPLIAQVASGVDRFDRALASIEPVVDTLDDTLALLPSALGAEGPRNYLLLVQNISESRGTGGNPAAIALLTATDGAVALSGQASSSDFPNGIDAAITPLNPETEALYGDKIGRYIQDSTLSPDFTETAEIVRAFWTARFGTPVDAVISVDPVALSYILTAIGPVSLPTGDVLTDQNAVDVLLSDIYWQHTNLSRTEASVLQDEYFAGVAGAVFFAVLHQSPDPFVLIDMLSKAIDEGRILYAPSNPEEAARIADSRLSGTLPVDNVDTTVTGVYVNDITEGKLDYYMQLDVAAAQSACSAEMPTFTTTATLTNTLTDDLASRLPWHVATARYFPQGDVSTDLVIYGPVGSMLSDVTVDGVPVSATALPHLGRPAVKINVVNTPGETHTVTAVFVGADGTDGAAYGPLEIRHTPMVRPVTTTIDAPGCTAD